MSSVSIRAPLNVVVKTHDKEIFYKYVTNTTVRNIFNNRQVRWSSPLLFNDPFDTQFGLVFGFELEDLTEPFLKEFKRLVFGPDEPNCDEARPLCLAVKLLRTIRHKLSREQFIRQSRADLEQGISTAREVAAREDQRWREYLTNIRLFCVAEEYDNLLMWAHYTDSHKGAVIGLRCIPELDTALCAAKPIVYRGDIPVVATMDNWIKHISGQIRLDFNALFDDQVFCKSDHWSYEKEWRCLIDSNTNFEQLFEMRAIYPEEIESLYLGCKMLDADWEGILNLLGGDLKHVKVFQAITNKKRFQLNFEQIK